MNVARVTSRAVIGLTAVAATLSATGAAYQAIATGRERRKHVPPGKLVDIGGYKLHLVDQGAGQPAVILEAGLTSMSAQWAWVQPEVAKITRVCSYDRAGLGWSECSTRPRDARNAVHELHTLLEKAGVPPPYILAGHSLGGLLARLFAYTYRDEVVGLVLVDAAHPDQRKRYPPASEEAHASFFRQLAIAPWLARVGVLRLTGYRSHMTAGLPPESAAVFRTLCCWERHLDTTNEEAQNWDTICDQVREADTLGDLPVAVISAGFRVDGMTEQWHCLQRELAALSTNSMLRIVPGSDHVSLMTRREHAQATVEAIQTLVHAYRQGIARPWET